MTRRFMIASGKVGPLFDSHEERARARYLLARRIPGTDIVVTDLGLYPGFGGSAGLRAAAEVALVAELEASIREPRK